MAIFFKLSGNPTKFFEQEEVFKILRNSPGLEDVEYWGDILEPPNVPIAKSPFKDKTFRNVSFKDTIIQGIVFENCKFVRCLFTATQFVDCSFYNCEFKKCSPHKVRFTNTYINPSVFEGMLDESDDSNIGINLFHQLYENSTQMQQFEFASTAEFNRQKWRRYHLNYKLREGQVSRGEYCNQWLSNYLSYLFTGYGVKFRFVAIWTSVFLMGSFLLNLILWDCMNVVGRDGPSNGRELFEILYYTVTIVPGVGDLTPTSSLGRLMFLIELISGFLVISIFMRWLVRRAVR